MACGIQDEGAPLAAVSSAAIPVRVKLKTPLRNAAAATTVDIPSRWDLQQRRPRPVADAGRSCWGSGQQDASAAQGTRGCWEPQPEALNNSPLGLWLRCCAPPPCSIPVRVKLKIPRANAAAATTVDVPTGWDPNTTKEPTGLFFAACGRPCSFDSSYGLHETATTIDIPSRWDPRTKQQSTGLLFATCRWPCCSIPVRVKLKTPLRIAQRRFYDPYGNRTHVTAVKGPCLNRLTNGP